MDDFQGVLTCKDCGKRHLPKENIIETQDLYNAADVKKVREQFIKEQDKRCAITGIPTALSDFHLDHRHDDEQLVRGAAHKSANMALGKIENLAVRYLYWYPHGLPSFLRACADYLEKPPDKRFRHNGWLKKSMTWFNKLTEPQKKLVLTELGQPVGSNAKERKVLFQRALLTKKHSFDTIRSTINQAKGVE